jgi:hypothetical protein
LWKEDKERELNAEKQNAQRSEEEGTGSDLEGKAERGRNIVDGSRGSYRLSIVFLITEMLFEPRSRKLKDFKELGGG